MCSVTASHAKDPGFDSRRLPNRLKWWLSPVTMQWLEKSSLVTLLVNWIQTEVDFNSGHYFTQLGMWYRHDPDW